MKAFALFMMLVLANMVMSGDGHYQLRSGPVFRRTAYQSQRDTAVNHTADVEVVAPCVLSDDEAITTGCKCASFSDTNECEVEKYCYALPSGANVCKDNAKGHCPTNESLNPDDYENGECICGEGDHGKKIITRSDMDDRKICDQVDNHKQIIENPMPSDCPTNVVLDPAQPYARGLDKCTCDASFITKVQMGAGDDTKLYCHQEIPSGPKNIAYFILPDCAQINLLNEPVSVTCKIDSIGGSKICLKGVHLYFSVTDCGIIPTPCALSYKDALTSECQCGINSYSNDCPAGHWCWLDNTCNELSKYDSTWHYPSNNTEWGGNCETGENQSPIDLEEFGYAQTRSPLTLNYNEDVVSKGADNGHSLVWNPVSQSQLSWGTFQFFNHHYNLVQFHVHTKSEHTVQGHRHDLEFHFVHETEKNDLAVIGILCNAADDVSDEVKEFEDSLKASLKSDDGVVINPNLLFNSVNTTKYYQYDGSLTTPPCHEDVIWTIIADECTVSQDFVNWLGEKNTMNNNYRAIQPLNERQIDHLKHHWLYPSDNTEWGGICESGEKQSPIDLPLFAGAVTRDSSLTITYEENTLFKGADNGHTLVWKPTTASGVFQNNGILYDLAQIHLHTKSEHTSDGKQHALEIHLVHSSPTEDLAIIGILCKAAHHASDEINEFEASLKASLNGTEGVINLNLLLNSVDTTKYYEYDGSLTTPPCSENVEWTIIADECTVSESFLDWLSDKHSMKHNYRTPQPLNHRTIDGELYPCPIEFYEPITDQCYCASENENECEVGEYCYVDHTGEIACHSNAKAVMGFDDCPCLDFTEFPQDLQDAIMCSGDDCKSRFDFPSSPKQYGSSCAAWENMDTWFPDCHPKNEDSAPDFCNKKWCYVDPDACTRNNPISSYFIKTKGFTEDMHYSYDTCGHENSWSAPAPVNPVSEVELAGDFSAITDLDAWLADCTAALSKPTMKCESARSGSVIVTISAANQADLDSEVTNIQTSGITIAGTVMTVVPPTPKKCPSFCVSAYFNNGVCHDACRPCPAFWENGTVDDGIFDGGDCDKTVAAGTPAAPTTAPTVSAPVTICTADFICDAETNIKTDLTTPCAEDPCTNEECCE